MKIFVKAKTNSHRDEVIKIDANHFEVRTTELPINNRANLAIIKLLTDYFDTNKSQVTIIKGLSSRNKILEIQ